MKLIDLYESPISDRQKDVKKSIKMYFGKTKIRIKSYPGTGEWIEVRLVNWLNEKMPIDLRHAAIDVIYSKGFTRDKNDAIAGNVKSNMITMTAKQWDRTFMELL